MDEGQAVEIAEHENLNIIRRVGLVNYAIKIEDILVGVDCKMLEEIYPCVIVVLDQTMDILIIIED